MTSNRRRNLFRWFVGLGLLSLLFLLITIHHLSRLEATDHRNLSYLMWKAGLRDYDRAVALPGMLHDHPFRESLRGITVSDFHAKFPSTFRITPTPSDFGKESTFLTDASPGAELSYAQLPPGWIVHFRNGKLVSFGYHKGVP